MANLTTITINGKVYEGKVDLVLSLISSGLITEVSEVKAEKKATTNKKSGTKPAAKKSNDNFDRDEYEALSKYFMVYGKHGCYRFARKTIYGIMGKGYVVNGEVSITKRTRNSILKTLTSEAEKCGEAWATDKMAEIKEAMA